MVIADFIRSRRAAFRIMGAVCGASLAFSMPVVAQAQQNTAPVARDGLEEILVTSRRREESLLDTPQSISALTAAQMQEQGVYSIDEAAQYVPNLTLNSANRANNTYVVIRGIGGGFPDPVRVFGSGMYIDGHYIPSSFGGYMSTMDIERIEVLRGPQGTLFGKNITGGAVNIISTKPQEEFDANALVRLTDDGQRDFRGMVNVPFADNLFGRFSVASEEFDGYYRNRFLNKDSGGTDSLSARGALRLIASDEWIVDGTAYWTQKRDDNLGGQCIGPGHLDDAPPWASMGSNNQDLRMFPGAEAAHFALCAADMAAGDFVNSSEKDTFSDVDEHGYTLGVDWQPVSSGSWNSMAVKAKAAYRNMQYDYLADRDYMSWPIDGIGTTGLDGGYDSETTSLEILFEGEVNDSFRFTTGVNFFDETTFTGANRCHAAFAASGGVDDPGVVVECMNAGGLLFELVPNNTTDVGVWPNGPRINNGGPAPFFQNVSVWNESIGVFGNATYEFNETWKVDFGARYTRDKRRFNNIEFAVQGCNVADNPSGLCDFQAIMTQSAVIDDGFFNAGGDTFSAFTPMVSLTRNIQNGILYALYSEGFLTGGFNTEINSNLPLAGDILAYDPERVSNYELGFKGRLLDDTVEISSNVFYMDYRDQQRLQTIDNPGFIYGPSNPLQIISNVASSAIYGVEFELRATPWDGGYLTLDVGYLDNSYDEYSFEDPENPGTFIDFSDFLIDDRTPDWTVNLAADHQFVLNGGATIKPRANIYWQSGLEHAAILGDWATSDPRSSCYQGAYTKLDARVTYAPASGAWQLAAYGNNLTDERIIDFCDSSRGVWRQRLERPRYFGLEYSMSFGG